ncbi:hypothetical protein PY092_19260 [Muricauda sp. 334s03]|uniref:Collagen-like protein n=1 Tax=Flagellimonas yonaguniensis TaxID=3031325 RepID=A0ABT5Y4E0_9FLAO|nr:hypothetical protein [[Muricauda] yonaguniensis]MDF0718307.1 hypothetical protein [[Muricauda] yonaguniensis]
MKSKIFFKCMLPMLCIAFNSCLVEDGEDGIDGIDGVDGKNGIDGIDGQHGQDGAEGPEGPQGESGEDGAGLEEMAQYGWISMNLNGTRPDDVAFEHSTEFKFAPVDATDFGDYNIVTATPMGDDTEYFFNFRRFYSSPDGTYNITYFDWEVTITNPGQDTEAVGLIETSLNNYGVVGDDNKYFILDDSYDSDGEGVSGMELTNVVFEPENRNHLSFSYSFSVDAANNGSGHELNVSGEVNVFLVELIE